MIKVLCKSIVIILLIGVAENGLQAQSKFIGVKNCIQCHKSEKSGNQHEIWKNSKHSQAYASLANADSAHIAWTVKTYNKRPWEVRECLQCHATAYDVDASLLGKDYDVKDGVQCESCHGAGSEYKSMAIMKDKPKAVAAGLQDFKAADSMEKLCGKCHSAEGPICKSDGFVAKTEWEKIKHNRSQSLQKN